MSKHTIKTLQTGTHPTLGDWEVEYEITFEYRPGAAPIIHPADNADPGYPAEVEFLSIKPDAGDHGAFTDLAQEGLEDWARQWIETDGYAEACSIAEDERQQGPDR